ncbi:hypothetical protein [Streptomyces sp. TRM64462]|uniref:hypothetical protein n=1 Tax=Streptomyces sp. TRM64462 TaxID=2741726 RepID=UPI001586C588|nr:hypothetical protein [Streptomyces sp. TRM64462]
MNLRTTTALVAAVATGALLLPLTGAAQAKAPSAAPGFLAPADLPPASTDWHGGPVTKGTPEFPPFCLDKVLPAKGATWHRQFGTELETGAVQISVTAPSTTAARRLAAAAGKAAADCAADWLRRTPGGTASWADYGKLAVEEGAHVYGVHTSIPESEPGVHLIGVGRDGRTVTVVQWGQMGDLSDAPVPAFKRTTATAVNKLH